MSSILSMLDVVDIEACIWFCKLLSICVCRPVCIGVGRFVSIDTCRPDCALDCIAFSRLLCICACRVFCRSLCMVEGAWPMGWSNNGGMWLEFWPWFWTGRLLPEELSSCEESGLKWRKKKTKLKLWVALYGSQELPAPAGPSWPASLVEG